MSEYKFYSYNALATAVKNEFINGKNVNAILNKKFVKESKYGQFVKPYAIIIDRKRYTPHEIAVLLKQRGIFVNIKDSHYTIMKNSNAEFFSIVLDLSQQKEYKKGEVIMKYYPSSLKTITNKDIINKLLPVIEEATIEFDEEGTEMIEEIDPEAL
ncbi:hypothetical protein TVAG_498250 [Trichomonas vaginalis G3]|uniref:Uncharacterized protein n=1 Tax=Trichomonas vaginalis (strain ATCC PRA-98 / G3) TaxID=412133 RepID=A2FLF5_TRIV3|nr:hypothetical protein TVAGG3_0638840 [Trichomonas vaginalis G3]XP_051087747.1 hypothetical protein TVAGG3_0638920 [Trichomonas vaginalis G3]EAX94271.1 hypothetical protein TVAG_498250 [Trichomonas vaginalis G3]KAI5505017.1 hypothetical protein TVAGG3_0638840 [Trichomonas vaginalis G3]KAI5505024.1 hypothetical protein TVAGG3_0638920 [Trichomonas vaginalis G3]|eukprot:XP_001307201.1 hypothetical protein [Trichomonas vaginalis G3]